MSCVFEANGVTLWNPSNTVARLFKAEAEAVASAFHVPSGLGDIVDDECQVDLGALQAFVAESTKAYQQSVHPILKSLTISVIATAGVLVQRAGGSFPALDPTVDAAWTQMRSDYGSSMSR